MAIAETEIVSTRRFAVSRDQLFAAFADAAKLSQWWGPKGFTNTFEHFDLRSGGEWKFTMHGPDGSNYANYSVFEEVVPSERIVFKHVSPPVFRMTITFDEQDEGTLLTRRMTFETAEVCNALKPICIPSNEENFDRLEAALIG
ncbi:MAG: SRPBCC family protein [Verrucomicrobiales bacterium]|nr:SRPBCC family protein [Verrucomicrobiales bacterium]MCP5559831.1 SRPBCC domain-containing protein [Verrucomicrobiaceae bacterium]